MKKMLLLLAVAMFFSVSNVSYASEVIDPGAATTESSTDEIVDEEVVEETDAEETDNESEDEEESPGESLYEESALYFEGDLVPDVEIEDIFVKIYDKLFISVTSSQKIAALIVIFFFVISAVGCAIMFAFNKSKVPGFIVAMLVCAIIFVCVLYAIPIMTAFEKWFVS